MKHIDSRDRAFKNTNKQKILLFRILQREHLQERFQDSPLSKSSVPNGKNWQVDKSMEQLKLLYFWIVTRVCSRNVLRSQDTVIERGENLLQSTSRFKFQNFVRSVGPLLFFIILASLRQFCFINSHSMFLFQNSRLLPNPNSFSLFFSSLIIL